MYFADGLVTTAHQDVPSHSRGPLFQSEDPQADVRTYAEHKYKSHKCAWRGEEDEPRGGYFSRSIALAHINISRCAGLCKG